MFLRKRIVLALALVVAVACGSARGEAATPYPIPSGYLHTSGNKILSAKNLNVRILGVNWFGLETNTMSPHGLWARGYKSMIAQMASFGFNTIRLPFSAAMLTGTAGQVGYMNPQLNPDLIGKTPLQIMDAVIAYARTQGLRVMLDMHSLEPDGNDGRWFSGSRSETAWIANWKLLAKRYANDTTVIGADLFNEPDGNWGTGGADDWARAAKAAGDAIHSVNGNWLIVVEGLRSYQGNYYWWGGGLQAVATKPIKLARSGRLVYSPHDYPPSLYEQPWFQGSAYPGNLKSVWESHWGFIETKNIAPLLLGEFGSHLNSTRDRQWAEQLASYVDTKNLDWMWFAINANAALDMGLLNQDWGSFNAARQSYLRDLIAKTRG